MLRTQLTTKMAEQRLVDMQLAEVREESEQFASIDLIKESQYSS